jgi:excisionase family DNA binding protein
MSDARDTETVPRFLTVGETAELLNVSPRILYAWVSQGRIPIATLVHDGSCSSNQSSWNGRSLIFTGINIWN